MVISIKEPGGKVQESQSWVSGSDFAPMMVTLVGFMSLLLCLSISNQSLWIDEGFTAWLASQENLPSLFGALRTLSRFSAEPLEPFYHLYMWAWASVFGMREFALRASNIPFAILLVSAFSWTSWRRFGHKFVWSVFVLSPFLWYYMNEARPYMPMMAWVTLSTAVLIAYCADRSKHARLAPWLCLFSFLLACGFHMLAAYFGPALLVLAMLEMREKRIDWKIALHDWKWPLLGHLVLFTVLAGYFLATLHSGARGVMGKPGLANVAFATYEFLGFSGLGPPRNELRAYPHLQALAPYAIWLFWGIMGCFGIIAIMLVAVISRRRDVPFSFLAALLTGGAFGVVLSIAAGHRFWGRHLAALYPLFMFAVLQLLVPIPKDKRTIMVQRTALMILALAWGVSSLRLRVLPQYGKDDYRRATERVLSEASMSAGTIVWVGDSFTARYYGLALEDASLLSDALLHTRWPLRGKAISGVNWTHGDVDAYLKGRSARIILAYSKPDLFDTDGAWASAIEELQAVKVASPNAIDIYVFGNRLPTKSR